MRGLGKELISETCIGKCGEVKVSRNAILSEIESLFTSPPLKICQTISCTQVVPKQTKASLFQL